MASKNLKEKEKTNSKSDNESDTSESESDEDLAVLELIDNDASSDSEFDDDNKEEDQRGSNGTSKTDSETSEPECGPNVTKPNDRTNVRTRRTDQSRTDGTSKTKSRSKGIDLPLSEFVDENLKVKRYHNATGTFIAGIDVVSKAAKEKREKRANRFGIPKDEQKTFPEVDVEDIAGVVLPQGSKIDGMPVRQEAIYLYGVDDMSTKDIFGYFKDFMPSSIEWIDDASCNVVWLDCQSAARALVGMSQTRPQSAPPSPKEEETAKPPQVSTTDSDEEPMEEDDEDEILNLISNKETGETERVPKSPPSSNLPADINTDSMQSRPDSEMSEQAMECLDMMEADMRPVEVKSKDITRVGNPHPKADELLMRFATVDDKKQKGAYKHSQYYLKYGNPNFGGYKGLISQSKLKHFRDGKYQPPESARRKRRHEYKEEDIEEDLEDIYPRKRPHHKPDMKTSRGNATDLRERLKKGAPLKHSSGSDGEVEEEEVVDEEAETLDAELKHALGDSAPKHRMQMYADEVEAKLKELREESEDTEPLYKVRDAREGLKKRLSVRDRLGHIRAAPTPASSLENLKIIVDTQDDISEKSSSESEEDEEEEQEEEEPETDLKKSNVKGPLRRDPDDLRAWLHNRETSRKLLKNLPSLTVEVEDDT